MNNAITLHTLLVSDAVHQLRAAQAWLDKAQAHADAIGFDSANYLGLRLAPDMLPLSRQVLLATELGKLGAARLAGVDAPPLAHDDTNLADLRARLQHAIDWLASISPAQVDDSALQELVVPQRGKPALVFDRPGFVRWWQGNFMFHATMTYALLRHAGVTLGKADFLALG